jgi:hypothetical protein
MNLGRDKRTYTGRSLNDIISAELMKQLMSAQRDAEKEGTVFKAGMHWFLDHVMRHGSSAQLFDIIIKAKYGLHSKTTILDVSQKVYDESKGE